MITYRGYRLNDQTGTTAYSRIDIYNSTGEFLGAESTMDDAKATIDYFVDGAQR